MNLEDLPAPQLAEVRRRLVDTGEEAFAQAPALPRFVDDAAANAILTDLGNIPHAFVFGCLVDRQIPACLAWMVPLRIQERQGTLAMDALVGLSEHDWVRLLSEPTPAHRFCAPMGKILYRATQRVANDYDGDASRIWSDRPASARLVRRFLEFDGAGPKIATMAANILVRGFRIDVADRRYIDISADVQVRRVMARLGLVSSRATVEEVIYTARELSPDFPGVFDLALWELGQRICRPRVPRCEMCFLRDCCTYALANEAGGTALDTSE